MCGIAGILNLHHEPMKEEARLRAMADSMVHRGPNGEGYYVSGPVGLAHRRLSIIDISGGAQPIFNEDSSIVVVFNGEIYNHMELRAVLEARGHLFRTHSDTEVLVHAYEEYGPSFTTHLTGMFAFALWDTRRQQLFVARDRVGIKPFYYTIHNGQLLFASEIKALLVDPRVPRAIDLEALRAYLRLRYVPAPKTMFQGIYKLLPGHQMMVRNGQCNMEQYWDLSFSEEPIDERHCLDEFEKLFFEVCQQHLMSEVPQGVFLSGGLDSSSIAAALRKVVKGDLMTFTVGYSGEDTMNEFGYGQLVSTHLKTSHHEVRLSPEQFADWIPRLTWHLDEPIGDSACIPLFFLAQRAKERATVFQSGEGADEIFGGYSIYKKMGMLSRYHEGPLGGVAGALGGLGVTDFIGGKVSRYIRQLALPLTHRYRGVSSLFLDGMKRRIVKPELCVSPTDKSFVENTFCNNYIRVKAASELNQMLYVDTKIWLPDDLLVKADKMTMAASVELRVPFLDHRLIEFAAKLPTQLKIRHGETKYILKKFMESHLPHDVIYRPKKGFPVPIQHWFQQGLAQLAQDLIFSGQSTVSNFINCHAGEAMLRSHKNGEYDASDELWSLVVLEQWCRTFKVSV